MMTNNNKKPREHDVPRSEATIPTKLAEIRSRCRDLLDENGDIALQLDDSDAATDSTGAYNPYNRSA